MSNWPIPSDYTKILQHPRMAFRDERLKQCEIETLPNTSQPKVRAGNFALVYKGQDTSGENLCIRVFIRPSEERQKRYQLVHQYLNSVRVPSLVNFEYLPDEIRVADGRFRVKDPSTGKQRTMRFPVVTMQWVAGQTLIDWVQQQCTTNNNAALSKAADQWVEVARELRTAKIAHGDLQHGNVMVTNSGHLKLVDYDCMCVPALVNQRALENGVAVYQHRDRRDEENQLNLFPELDHFSSLVILIILRALAASPQLWQKYNILSNQEMYDNLLFRLEDYDNPTQSPLFQDLARSPDSKVRTLIAKLLELDQIPIHDVPPLETLLADFETIRQLLSAQSFDQAIELLDQQGGSNIPPDIKAQTHSARQKILARKQLEEALRAGDDRRAASLAQSPLLQNYPAAAALLTEAKRAAQALPILEKIRKSLQQQQGRQVVQQWDAQPLWFRERPGVLKLQSDVDRWRRRNSLCDDVVQLMNGSHAVAQPDRLAERWEKLKQLGGHPELSQRANEIEKLLNRHEHLRNFRSIPQQATADNDKQRVTAWREDLFGGWSEAAADRDLVIAAQTRLKQLSVLEATARKLGMQITAAGEKALFLAAKSLPAGYHPSLQQRAGDARSRLAAVEKLKGLAQKGGQPQEAELAAAWQLLRKHQAVKLIPAVTRERLELAAKRVPLLDRLRNVTSDKPVNQRDTEILSVWDETLLGDCHEAAPWRELWREAQRRKTLLEQMRKALAQNDQGLVARLSESDLLKQFPYPPEIRDKIARARDSFLSIQLLKSALITNDREDFVRLFDQRIIAASPGEFAAFQTQMLEWLSADLTDPAAVGLAQPMVGGHGVQSMGGISGDRVKTLWSWPLPRFSDTCVLTICRKTPRPGTTPAENSPLKQTLVTKSAYEASGGAAVLGVQAAWSGGVVAVWAEINLGQTQLYSGPVILGTLNTGR